MIDFSDLKALELRLEALQARYESSVAPIRDRERQQQQLKSIHLYDDANRLYDELCPYYWTATAEQRATIRALFRERQYLAEIAPFDYVRKVVSELQETQDENKLRLGLTALSIEDCKLDFRDTSVALGQLYKAAEDAGINPRPYFAEVAEYSSDQKPSGGNTPMKKMLADFRIR
jgi:hypothetical protein